MRVNSRVLAFFAALLLPAIAGCASEFERRFEEADGLRREAAMQGYEWIGTAGLLEQAREQAEQGNATQALVLVEQARFQAEAALQQAEREAEAWQDRVPR